MAKDTINPKLNFGAFLRKIKPTDSELGRAKSFALSCRKRLSKSFKLRAFKKIGSHSRNTAIRATSDLDFMAVFAREEAEWGGKTISSNTVLAKVSQDLDDRYALTNIRKDKQAVVVAFGGGQHSMDVVPAFFHSFNKGRPVYSIPDGCGGWIETSPEAHNKYIQVSNARSKGKLMRVGQLLRKWKTSRVNSIPISSFFIDMFLAASNMCNGVKSYPELVYEFFYLMAERECAGFNDPVGISSAIMPSRTDSQYAILVSSIESSLLHAEKAIAAESIKNNKEANKQWDMVFNHTFL